jgi:hypothetical protein
MLKSYSLTFLNPKVLLLLLLLLLNYEKCEECLNKILSRSLLSLFVRYVQPPVGKERCIQDLNG